MDDGAVVVRLGVEGLQPDGGVELRERLVVPAEGAERSGEARPERAVVGIGVDELPVRGRRLGELAAREENRREVPISRRRRRLKVAEAPELLEDLRVDLRVARGLAPIAPPRLVRRYAPARPGP